ncbi:MAG: alpha/beta fold hydrolase [Minisyncoccia bacterium]
MRIIGINGVWCWQNPVWDTLRPAFLERFSGATFIIEGDFDLWPHELTRMRRFIAGLCEKYDDGTPALLVGHSMGGIFALAVAAQLRRTKVLGITTIFSPHRFPFVLFAPLLGAGYH